jgi:hypothetical protein
MIAQRWPRWSRGLAAAGGLALAACAPAPPLYSGATPPVLMTTPAEAGIVDLRGTYRSALCRRLPVDGPRCDDVLLRLPGENPPASQTQSPGTLRRYRVAFVPGLFSECLQALARPFADVIPDLTRAGVDARYFSVAGRGSTATNSERLAQEIAALPDDGRPLIVVAYSKGLPDLLELVARRPESAARIAAIVSLAGAANGSLLADRHLVTYQRWLSGLPLVGCGSGTGAELGDLRRDVRHLGPDLPAGDHAAPGPCLAALVRTVSRAGPHRAAQRRHALLVRPARVRREPPRLRQRRPLGDRHAAQPGALGGGLPVLRRRGAAHAAAGGGDRGGRRSAADPAAVTAAVIQ